jgi:hypothetical protein
MMNFGLGDTQIVEFSPALPCLSAPGPHERLFAAYVEGLAEAAGHADGARL